MTGFVVQGHTYYIFFIEFWIKYKIYRICINKIKSISNFYKKKIFVNYVQWDNKATFEWQFDKGS